MTFELRKRILVAEQSDGSLVLFRVPRELRDVGGQLAAVVVLAAVVDAPDLVETGLPFNIFGKINCRSGGTDLLAEGAELRDHELVLESL